MWNSIPPCEVGQQKLGGGSIMGRCEHNTARNIKGMHFVKSAKERGWQAGY